MSWTGILRCGLIMLTAVFVINHPTMERKDGPVGKNGGSTSPAVSEKPACPASSESYVKNPRILDVGGLYNVRDLGGLCTVDGKTVRYGKLIRGSELDGEHDINITEAGIRTLRDEIGISYDLDMRSDDETDMIIDMSDGRCASSPASGNPKPITSSPLGKDVEYTRIPLRSYLRPWTTLTSPAEIIKGQKYYVAVFRIIFDCVENDKPVYMHCWAGADRTGTVCYLLEGLLGVSEAEMGKDYELTSLAEIFGERSVKSADYCKMSEYISDLDGVAGVSQADFHKFFRAMGFTEKQIKRFRSKMLNDNTGSKNI